jgi:hypothetical protein
VLNSRVIELLGEFGAAAISYDHHAGQRNVREGQRKRGAEQARGKKALLLRVVERGAFAVKQTNDT